MQTGQIKRVGNCWLLRYWETVIENGKTVRRRKAKKLATYSREYRTEDDVRALADVILAPINANIAKPESTDTVLSFLENVYLKHVREAKKPSTAKSYTDMFKLVEPHLKLSQIRLRDFDTADADKLLRDVAKEKARAHTANKNLKSFLSGAFKYAKRNRLISGENPVRDAEIPRGKPKSKRPAYTLDEVTGMLEVLPEPSRTIVFTAALTGLRLCELKGLRWEDFSDDAVLVQRAVWQGKVNDTKTLSSRETVPVVSFLTEQLEAHKRRNSGTGFVFHGETGQPLWMENVYRRDMKEPLEEAKIKWRGWHPFRYGVGTLLHSLGVDSKIIQAILRHANVSTTLNYYVKPFAEESRHAMKKLEDAFKAASAERKAKQA